MLRSLAFASLLLLLTVPASGMKVQLYQLPGDTLATAAAMLRSKDYTGAARLAKGAPAGGARDFIAGVAAFRAKEWDEASNQLLSAARNFELLADYALFFQALALNSQKKYDEALVPLLALLKLYPESPLKRQATMLTADLYYSQNNYKGAIQAYQKYIETYPSGSDSLTAQYRMARCREALGEQGAAVKIFRNLWLTNPSSPLAATAEEDLKRLSTSGPQPAPYTTDELMRRGSTLFDLKKFAQSVTAFKSVPRDGQSRDFLDRLDLRNGQALYRNRNYRDAETLFSKIASTTKEPAHAAEATYWTARCMDRNDRHDEAVKTFLQVVEKWPKANESDNSLLEAALIKKSELRWTDALALVQRLLKEYPDTSLKKQGWWEGGWCAYKAGEMQIAGNFFGKLSESDAGRDRALYWLSRVKAASGDEKAAQSAYSSLLREFPMSFYSLAATQAENSSEAGVMNSTLPKIDRETLDTLPLPSNNERVRALITLGLYEEAKKELASVKIKPNEQTKLLGVARLYLEMDDFNGAFNLVRRDPLRSAAKDQNQTLALLFPLPFRDTASKHADYNSLPLPLVFAIIRAESSFSPTAVSPAGAVGLMQLMPSTAAMIEGAGRKSLPTDKLTQPELNINYGTRHLKDLIAEYSDNLIAVIASYNAGGGTVNRWKRSFGTLPDLEFIEQIPYSETRDYVKQVIASTAIYAKLYNLPLKGIKLPLPPKPVNTL